MVQEICRDIKKLDYAKRHLIYTITSLKRFHMLVTAVDQLDFMVENRQYKDTADLLMAVAQLFQHFENHGNIATIIKLKDSVFKTREMLAEQINRDFEALSEVSADYSSMGGNSNGQGSSTQGPSSTSDYESSMYESNSYDGGGGEGVYEDPSSPVSPSLFYSSDAHTPESLAGACAVVDALGSKERRKLITKVCEVWLQPYEALFGPGKEFGGLEAMDRRYAWLRRLIRDNEERYARIFPAEWCINRHVLSAFVQKTEAHIKGELRKIDPPDSADVSALVWALRKTLDFEHEMAVKFEYEREARGDVPPDQEGGDSGELFDENGERVDSMSAKGIRLRKEREREQSNGGQTGVKRADQEQEEEQDMDQLQASRGAALADAKALVTVKGVISTTFEPYLTAYVKLEANKMKEELDQEIKDENVLEEGALRLKSSSQMFLLIRKSINRCTQFTKGQAFYSLYTEFKKVLSDYSTMLNDKLPAQGKHITADGVTLSCFVCNAAEYCNETVPQLEELIQDKINDAYRETIDMDEVVTLFSNNLMASIQAMVAGVHASIDGDLATFGKTNWAQFKEVGDQSKYVSTLSAVLREHAPRVREQLKEVTWYRKFCSMLAETLIARFRASVFRCRKVSEAGSQQLLLDAQALKSILLKLPTLGIDNNDSAQQEGGAEAPTDVAFQVHTKFVTGEMQRMEALIKLVGLSQSPDLLIEYFKTVLEGGTTEDLRMVLEMKGTSKAEAAKTIRMAEEAGVPKGGANANATSFKLPSSPVKAPAPPRSRAGANGTDSSSSKAASFSNVFSSVSASLGQVASGAPTSTKWTASSLSATFSQSYNRAVNKGKGNAGGSSS